MLSTLDRSPLTRLRDQLPRGGMLPSSAWQQRHRGIMALIWLHVLGFALFTTFNETARSWHSVSEFGAVGVLAALATWAKPGRTARTLLASTALIASSALLVHISDGIIEVHFHFFVAMAVIALYEDWVPYLLALGYVLIDHGVVGTLQPTLIYNHPDAWAHPWVWAAVHAAFILCAGIASIVHWRLSEIERARAADEHGARVTAEAELEVHKHAEDQLKQQAQLLELAQDAIFVWELESGAIRYWNRGAEDLYGWPKEDVLGRTPAEILHTQFPQPLREIRDALEHSGRWEGELIHTCRDGSRVVVVSRWAMEDPIPGQPVRAMAINSDITEQKRVTAELEHQAQHDGLTGLPNRVTLAQRLEDSLTSTAEVALLMLDLDRFKEVNDTLGHDSGDHLLRQVGPRLLAGLRDGDTLARLGGDEFAVLLPHTSIASAQVVAHRLLQTLEAPFELAESTVSVAGSIGIAVSPHHGTDAETLLRCADVAMYVAKRTAAGTAVYDASQDQHSRDRLAVAGELRRALDTGELTLHFQPKLDCQTRELVGVEALVRWQHPQRGLVPPDEFIHLAEQTGLISQLDRCVIQMAAHQWREWRAIGLSVPIAVNLSMLDLLDPELPGLIQRQLRTAGLEEGALRIEITETSLMVDPVRVLATLERLRGLGVRLSVDDYGTGYSSLRYLQQLPVDELKIDRSFVRTMMSNESDRAIVESTIDLAHRLGLQVVAEGVEDVRTLDRLGRAGCDQVQGYYLSRPLPAQAFVEWLAALERDSEHRAA